MKFLNYFLYSLGALFLIHIQTSSAEFDIEIPSAEFDIEIPSVDFDFADAPKSNPRFYFPDEKTIRDKIEDVLGSSYFNEKTKLSERLANTIVYKAGLENAITFAYYDFQKYLKESGLPDYSIQTIMITLMISRDLIMESLLEICKQEPIQH